MYVLSAAACLLTYLIAIHTILRICGIRFPVTGWRRENRIARYRLGFWQYVVFVCIVEYGIGVVIFSMALDYFHHGAIGLESFAKSSFVGLLTGLLAGVSSYETPKEL